MTQSQKISRTALWGMVIILLFAGAVAISRINIDTVWFDEERTFQKVGGGRYLPLRGPSEIIEHMMYYGDTWPPFYNFAFAGWGYLTGWSIYTHRIMAWLFGLLGIAATYRLGVTAARETNYRYWVGLVAAGLLSTSAFYIYYLHEMRGYTMSVFLIIMSVWLYWRLVSGSLRWNLMLLFVFFNVCVLYTHYIPAIMLMSIGLYHLMSYRQIPAAKWWKILGLLAVSVVFFLPWFTSFILVLGDESSTERGLSTLQALSEMLYRYGNGLWILLPILMGTTAWYVRKESATYLWIVAVGFTIFALAANYPIQYLFNIRHTISLLPIMLAIVALGVVAMYYRGDVSLFVKLGITALLPIWAIAGIGYSFNQHLVGFTSGAMPADTTDIITEISSRCIGQNDKAVFHITDEYEREWGQDPILLRLLWTNVPFEYANLNKLRYVPDQYDLRRPLVRINTQEPTDYTERVRWYTDDSDRIWLFSRSNLPRDQKIAEFESVLQQDYATCGRVQSQAGLDVYVWSNTTAPTCEPLGNPALAPCTDDIVKLLSN